jgi:hypothetical protein
MSSTSLPRILVERPRLSITERYLLRFLWCLLVQMVVGAIGLIFLVALIVLMVICGCGAIEWFLQGV